MHEKTIGELTAKWKQEVDDVKKVSAMLTSSTMTELNGKISNLKGELALQEASKSQLK